MIKLQSDITVMPVQKMGGDAMVAAAAWVSTNGEDAVRRIEEDEEAYEGLIRSLIRQRHGTPFEHAAMTFFVHAPIFVWREWHRHRVGFCLPGSTEIWAESYAPNSGRTLRKQTIERLSNNWNEGVTDTLGRTRFLPSVYSQKLRVLNEESQLFESAPAEDVFPTGIKEIFELRTEDPRYNLLRSSADHRILTPEGWAAMSDLRVGDYVMVNGKRNANPIPIPPSLRRGIGVWTSMQRNSLILSVDRCIECGEQFEREQLVLDHKVPVAENIELALSISNLQPMCKACHRRKTDAEQSLASRDIRAGSKPTRITQTPTRVGEEQTYDIAMSGPHHNFVANGFVVHNSYNEQSGRYMQLEPVFWIPRKDRPMMKPKNYRPMRPSLDPIEPDALYADQNFVQTGEDLYDDIIRNSRMVCGEAYRRYKEELNFGVAPEVARRLLPVSIYSSSWVTCNPRSLMHFLSLRTHEPDAAYVSYPQAEIEEAARVAEQFLAEGWPLTHKYFNEFGRAGV